MRLPRRAAGVVVTAAALALVVGSVRTSNARPLAEFSPGSGAEQREIARIGAHFDSVLTELDAVPAPRALAGARRAAIISTLRAYRDRGVFPHNYDFPDRATPYFVDRHTGTLCAVAHLLEHTGRRDIVERVAETNNNVWVATLAADSAFTGWLAENGITLAEAARIQVPYVAPSSPAQVARNTAFIVAAPIALGSAAVTTVLNAFGNADGHQRASRIIGFASGLVSAGVGATLMTKPEMPRQLGAMTAAVGGLSIALASRATGRHRALVAQRREAEQSRGSVQASLSPVVGGSGTGTGVALSIRY
ncbi:MAG: hypothetical protein JWL95_1245 [Gemmatimonadetes bacterium]|nr:hypothetical protein [Gemmatimonadota bacterium]